MRKRYFSVAGALVAGLAIGWLAPSAALARTYLDHSGNTTDMTYYIGNANGVPTICWSHGTGSETWVHFSSASTMDADWEFDLSTGNSGGNHHVTVIFIRDGVNEPAANNDCGFNATAWTNLAFGGHYLVIHTGDGDDFIESPSTGDDVEIYTHGGSDVFNIWYHAGTYDGGNGADTMRSQWHGDYTTGGEWLYGGAGFDTMCDLQPCLEPSRVWCRPRLPR